MVAIEWHMNFATCFSKAVNNCVASVFASFFLGASLFPWYAFHASTVPLVEVPFSVYQTSFFSCLRLFLSSCSKHLSFASSRCILFSNCCFFCFRAWRRFSSSCLRASRHCCSISSSTNFWFFVRSSCSKQTKASFSLNIRWRFSSSSLYGCLCCLSSFFLPLPRDFSCFLLALPFISIWSVTKSRYSYCICNRSRLKRAWFLLVSYLNADQSECLFSSTPSLTSFLVSPSRLPSPSNTFCCIDRRCLSDVRWSILLPS